MEAIDNIASPSSREEEKILQIIKDLSSTTAASTANATSSCATTSTPLEPLRQLENLLKTESALSTFQNPETGVSPLMLAASDGQLSACRLLIEYGAPWNAIDRHGDCAGNYAVNGGHQEVIDYLVDVGVQSELILGTVMRGLRTTRPVTLTDTIPNPVEKQRPVEHESSTKPDYLTEHTLHYNTSNTALLDNDNDAVMMEWERPLMSLHASIITSSTKHKRVLNVGFGMGIIDSILQDEWEPSLHIIIEAHPDVYGKMLRDGWNEKENVEVYFGKWQDVMPRLIEKGVKLDGIFFDTYGEHGEDMEDFHESMVKILAPSSEEDGGGVYSWFNGLASDNVFFQGVTCQCLKLQLGRLGLNTEFMTCDIEVGEKEWEGVRRKYWFGKTYYLPVCRWK